ncbi:MAG: glycosyltransferase [Clostridia bacterium]|nr:glycosyltransferase [Clostridia bacterium]
MTERPLVTVCLLAYNQARYIRQCAESLLAQETDFPFLILAHDDASTDGTDKILSEYAERYPDRFRLIAEEENTYSKDTRVMARHMWPLIDSPYTAICEGDDYWTDPRKLAIQVGYLEEHPEYALSVSNAHLVNGEGEPAGELAPYAADTDMPVEDLIAGGGGFIATASVVTRTAYLRDLPEYYFRSTVGDAPLQLYLASLGKTRWHAGRLCAYRVNAAGSWTLAQLTGKRENYIRFHTSMADMLTGFDEATGGAYHTAVGTAVARHRFEVARLRCDLKTMRSAENAGFYRAMTGKERRRVYLMKYCPWAVALYRRFRFGGK